MNASEPFVSWRAIEAAAGLDGLGELHRNLLRCAGVAGAGAFDLRRAQQRAEAELNRLARSGEVRKADDDWWLPARLVRQVRGV